MISCFMHQLFEGHVTADKPVLTSAVSRLIDQLFQGRQTADKPVLMEQLFQGRRTAEEPVFDGTAVPTSLSAVSRSGA